MKITQEQRRENYRRGRAELIAHLGGKCVDCDEDNPKRLEFDHLTPRTWKAKDVSRWVRLARYRREAEAGQIELRCRSCNASKGEPIPLEEVPF